jgi:hypothetical protein
MAFNHGVTAFYRLAPLASRHKRGVSRRTDKWVQTAWLRAIGDTNVPL